LNEFSIERLGDCEIVREIGRGGMGVVFEAYQGQWKRRVAVKMLPWRFGEALPRWKERFHHEAQTIAQLRHPNIVPIYTFGEHAGYCYYAMQFVEGLSLDRVLAGLSDPAALPASAQGMAKRMAADHWPSFARIAAQVALALEHAHSLNVLHNDIKPANLLLDASGQILLTDFSAHRLRTEFEEQTERGSGTYRYLAPERLAAPSDVRGDVYSLGVTLYELLTRRPAFDAADRTELLDQITRSEFPPPRAIRPNIPWTLEAIVLKAMSLKPEDRYQSAREFRRDLMRFLHDQPITARRPNAIRRFANWCQSRLRAKPAQ
jgi:serine/threonine protein kinase